MLTSCDDYLSVQPMNQLIPETVEHYNMFSKSASHNVASYSDFMTDDVLFDDAYVPNRYSERALRAYVWDAEIEIDETVNEAYKNMYNSINIGNIILEAIDDAKGDDEVLRSQVKGKAFAFRGMNHFYLVNQYGKHYNTETSDTDLGAPLVLSNDIEVLHSRATVKDMYDQVIKDLTEAANLLPTRPKSLPAYNVHPSKVGVWGLLSRVYLYMGNWAKAEEFGEKALNVHDLLIDLKDIPGIMENSPNKYYAPLRFKDQNPEVLWGQGTASYQMRAYYDVLWSDDLISIIDTNKVADGVKTDLRWIAFAEPSYYLDTDKFRYSRYKRLHSVNRGASVPEVMLNVAEAKARQGDTDGALALINKLGLKRYNNFDDYTAANADEALDIVKKERRIELAFKGSRLFDLKRYTVLGEYNETITRGYQGVTYTLEPNSPRYLLPFSPRIIMLNPNIEQNPR